MTTFNLFDMKKIFIKKVVVLFRYFHVLTFFPGRINTKKNRYICFLEKNSTLRMAINDYFEAKKV